MRQETTRRSAAILATLGLTACKTQVADLGGQDPCVGEAGPPPACTYQGGFDDGGAYFQGQTNQCSSPDGSRIPAGSVAEVTSAIVGVWASCAGGGLRLSTDGTYAFLTGDEAADLVPTTDPSQSGAFSVVDASATLGPGDFQIRFTASNGGVTLMQVVVLGSPSKLRLFAPTGTDFVPAQQARFRAGVCGPRFVAPPECNGSDDLLSRMQGRWVWCSGPPDFDTPGLGTSRLGVEISGTDWTYLVDDGNGNAVATGQTGVLQLRSDSALWTTYDAAVSSIETRLPVVDACGRVLLIDPVTVCQGNTGTCAIAPDQSQVFARSP